MTKITPWVCTNIFFSSEHGSSTRTKHLSYEKIIMRRHKLQILSIGSLFLSFSLIHIAFLNNTNGVSMGYKWCFNNSKWKWSNKWYRNAIESSRLTLWQFISNSDSYIRYTFLIINGARYLILSIIYLMDKKKCQSLAFLMFSSYEELWSVNIQPQWICSMHPALKFHLFLTSVR